MCRQEEEEEERGEESDDDAVVDVALADVGGGGTVEEGGFPYDAAAAVSLSWRKRNPDKSRPPICKRQGERKQTFSLFL